MLPELRPYEPSYYLLEESRKSWDHIVSDEIVYALDSSEITIDARAEVSKHYLEGSVWIEVHLTFEAHGDAHYIVILMFDERASGKREHIDKFGNVSVDRDSPVLIDVAKQIQPPKKVTLDGRSIG